MKKFVALFLITAVALGTTLGLGNTAKSTVAQVTAHKISAISVEDTVICTGKVEYEQTRNVRSSVSGVIEKMFVRRGEKVKKGDVLFSVMSSSVSVVQPEISTDDIYDAVKSGDYSSLSEYARQSQGSVESVQNEGEIIEVTSPINGEILNIEESAGSPVSLATEVLTVVSGDELCINLPVNESKIAGLEIGQTAVITGSGFKKSSYLGEVYYVDRVAQQVSTTTGKETAVEVKVRVSEPKEDIKQGYSAKCSIITSINENALIIPYEAIIYENEPYVYVYRNGQAEKNYIKTGNEYENGVEVINGLNSGDIVVTSPEQIRDMQKIRISECVVNTDA